jgi:orotate phosphoribosyltransferase
MSEESKAIVSKIIARTGILNFGDFLLANGLHTQYYLNFSILANKPEYLTSLVNEMITTIKDKGLDNNVTKLVGILNKGALFIPPLSLQLKKPFGLFQKYENEIVLGSIDSNDSILIIDDMISTGKTVERTYRILTNLYNTKVSKLFVVIDREEGGVERLKKLGLKTYSILKVTELADILYSFGVISDEEKDIIYSEVKEKRRRLR